MERSDEINSLEWNVTLNYVYSFQTSSIYAHLIRLTFPISSFQKQNIQHKREEE
jgi:hypothetical protein